MYEELIAALRYNGRDYKGSLMDEDDKRMCGDAADAIERLTAEIDRKDKALQAWVKTWEQTKGKLIDRICENCETPPDVRLRVCGECPIIQPIREVFDEQQS